MLSPITTPPVTITPEEHSQITSSTPESFVDIPPILRWYDEEVEVSLSSLKGGWEGWNVKEEERVKGKLWVNEISVAFIPSNPNSTPGFNLPFPSLTLHALTPASGDIPAHLYCQVDESDAPISTAGPSTTQIGSNGNGNGYANGNHEDIKIDQEGKEGDDEEDEEEDDDDDDGEYYGGDEDEFTEMREIRIFLDESKLQPLFQALSFCSALHDSILPNGEPSSFFGFGGQNDDEGEEEEEGQWEDADENQDGNGNGAGRIIYFPSSNNKKSSNPQRNAKSKADVGSDDKEVGEVVDQMERFLGLVDWGNVKKPKGWDDE